MSPSSASPATGSANALTATASPPLPAAPDTFAPDTAAPPHSVPNASLPSQFAPAPATLFRPTSRPSSGHPTRSSGVSLPVLLDFVRRTATDTDLIAALPLDPEGRTWIRLEGPGGSEAWLIGWPPGTGTGWHDHGGSHGAFATARGKLIEQSLAAQLPTEGWKTLELAEGVDRERALTEGKGRSFGPHHVHQVLNLSPRTHAISVHAYYPPLPLMRRYSRTGPVLRLEQVEQPGEWT